MTGKNQSYARLLNNQLIMRELRDNCCSATMLSQKLNLSNAALSAILSDLLNRGVIKQVEVETEQNVGRKPTYYTINEQFGYIVVIGFANYIANVVVADMKMNIVASKQMAVEKYDKAMLYELVLEVKNILTQPSFRDIPLLGIDLSVPGKVNTQTGELQLAPQFDKDIFSEQNTIVKLFKDQFDVPVMMTNDINLAGLGELYYGDLKCVQNGMLVDIGDGIGGAFIFGGKMYVGGQGFGGEVGLMRTQFNGEIGYLDEFVSLRAVKSHLGAILGKTLHKADLVEMYGKNPVVTQHVNATANCLGKVLKDIVELLNVSTIVLSGSIRKFGDDYLKLVCDEVYKSTNDVKVVFSSLGTDACILGAIYKAVEALTDDIFI